MKTRIIERKYYLYTEFEPQYKHWFLGWVAISPNENYNDFESADKMCKQKSIKPIIKKHENKF